MRSIISQKAALLVIALSFSACSEPELGVDVKIVVSQGLKSDIRVTAKSVQKPGTKNPIEVSVTFENNGNKDHQILFDGRWQDDKGNGFGGTSDSRVIPAGSSTTFVTSTRSESVTKLVLRISETNLNSEQLVAKQLSEIEPAVPGHGLSYTANPSLDQIPNWPPKGAANGAPFIAGAILFAPINGVWELQIIDREIDPMKGLAMARSLEGNAGLQSIHLNLPEEPRTGKVFNRKLSYGGGYFQIQTSPGSPNTTSWNTSIAWVLEIKQWNRQPYSETGGTFQQGGKASGRLYICFKGRSDRIQDSYVAGVFENAPIVYYGNPDRGDQP